GAAFDAIAAVTSANVILSGREQAREITAGMASAGLFPLIGAPPLLGRNFRPDEAQPGSDNVVLLDEGFWQSESCVSSSDRACIGPPAALPPSTGLAAQARVRFACAPISNVAKSPRASLGNAAAAIIAALSVDRPGVGKRTGYGSDALRARSRS